MTTAGVWLAMMDERGRRWVDENQGRAVIGVREEAAQCCEL